MESCGGAAPYHRSGDGPPPLKSSRGWVALGHCSHPKSQILRVVMGSPTPSVSKGMGGIGALQPPHHVKEIVYGGIEGDMELNRNREREGD